MNNILVIGTGELGNAILQSLYTHPRFTPRTHSLTTTIRPSTLSSPSSNLTSKLKTYQTQNITILPLDIETTTLESLTTLFTPFTTIIHASGMTLSPGTQLKVTQAAIASASFTSTSPSGARKLYIPWQFGLDYDTIGPTAGSGLFGEQCTIRTILRDQTQIDWVIVSCGIFTSFLFSDVWGVVPDLKASEAEEITVRALGGWDVKTVATTVEDIARCTAEVVLVDSEVMNTPVFIAGGCVSYEEVAEIVERVSGRKVVKELWDGEVLVSRTTNEPEARWGRYHVVFSEGVGTSWDVDGTYNRRKGMEM